MPQKYYLCPRSNLAMVVSIIIPTCNRNSILNITVRCAIAALKNIEGEIIVVNDSKNEEVTLSCNWDNIRVLKNPLSGAASARNYGAQNAQGYYLFFLDDDIILHPYSLSTLLRLSRSHPCSCFNLNWTLEPQLLERIVATYFGKYLIKHGFTSLRGWCSILGSWPDKQLIEVNSVASCTLWIEKQLFIKIGGYATGIPYAGFEDYILSKKLRESKISMYVYSDVLAYHNEEDRLSLEAWLERKKRGGATRAAAVIAGYPELKLRHSPLKRIIYMTAYYSDAKKYLLSLAQWFERIRLPLPLYFRTVNALLGLYHFEGYYDYLKNIGENR